MLRRALVLLRFMRARRPAAVVIALGLVIAASAHAVAAPIDPGTLNPVPPDSYACRATGNGAVCDAHTFVPYDGEATGLVCGSGANLVELIDSGIRDNEATRWYDHDGNLTRRIVRGLVRSARFTDPATGRSIAYAQHNTDVDDLAIPGDFGSSTWTGHGHLTMTITGHGAVLLEAGRTVVGPSGDIESQAGPTDLSDYYDGATAIADPLCAYLGTPNS